MRIFKPVVFLACLIPLGLLSWRAFVGDLTANPTEFITRQTGDWTLRLLLATLAVTPIRRLTGWSSIIRVRRMLGLFAFFYGSLHFLTFVVLDYFFAFDLMLEQVRERKFIVAGLTSFLLLIPPAVTSTQGMIRRLGGRRWQALHRLVYLSAVAGIVHYTWLAKSDARPSLRYAIVLAALLGARVWHHYHVRSATPVIRPAGSHAVQRNRPVVPGA